MTQTIRHRSQLVQAAERCIRNEQRHKGRIVFLGAVALLILLGVFA